MTDEIKVGERFLVEVKVGDVGDDYVSGLVAIEFDRTHAIVSPEFLRTCTRLPPEIGVGDEVQFRVNQRGEVMAIDGHAAWVRVGDKDGEFLRLTLFLSDLTLVKKAEKDCMSYCRWSSDDFQCDLYCYEDVSGGWTTHVAASRHIRKPTSIHPMSREALATAKSDPKGWVEKHRAYHDELGAIPLEPIGLAHDGETFNDATLEEFRDRLMMLKAAGYQFPDYVFQEVDAEIAEAALVKKVEKAT